MSWYVMICHGRDINAWETDRLYVIPGKPKDLRMADTVTSDINVTADGVLSIGVLAASFFPSAVSLFLGGQRNKAVFSGSFGFCHNCFLNDSGDDASQSEVEAVDSNDPTLFIVLFFVFALAVYFFSSESEPQRTSSSSHDPTPFVAFLCLMVVLVLLQAGRERKARAQQLLQLERTPS
eukprot:g58029.t1